MKMALERLEPCAMKVARTVLRRVVTGDSHDLSDTIGLQPHKGMKWREASNQNRRTIDAGID
jgi:hypothetical protein